MVCKGFEPGTAEWQVQTNPLSYGGPGQTFLKNGPTPASFGIYFWSLQANIITIFTTNISEKISIQYMVPGFEPTTFGT